MGDFKSSDHDKKKSYFFLEGKGERVFSSIRKRRRPRGFAAKCKSALSLLKNLITDLSRIFEQSSGALFMQRAA